MTNPINYIDVESRPVKWLVDGLRNQTIVVDNSFQRRYVWVQKDRVSLIETILLGYPIPEIYLWQNATDPDTGDTAYSVVDGQQRLASVQSFINDEFKLVRSALDDKRADYAGLAFSGLSPEQKSTIWKYPFSIRFIKDSVQYSSIVDLFLRLNRTNTTLNPQELRNAEFHGKFIELSAEISEISFWESKKIFSKSDIRRMLDVQFVSTLLLFIRSGIEEETTQAALNRIYDQYNESYPEADSDRDVLVNTLAVVNQLIGDEEYVCQIVRKKTHFYTLFVYGYYLLQKKVASTVLDGAAKKLNEWYEKYENDEKFDDLTRDGLLTEYRVLSQEGVQKKANRQRRFEIIKEYVGL
ncbi:DUF262 domain-containing protein [Rheinheimera hassiensis]|uniref:DUF262 domain-containing protein n=1 Tax=Rheinheimera hassiensis TaxID=1193627 RepID=UPI001F052CCC|nr:DUF262 domain-containing protein [Rheinheimera hassiensis]